jgi:hypothetical protein
LDPKDDDAAAPWESHEGGAGLLWPNAASLDVEPWVRVR